MENQPNEVDAALGAMQASKELAAMTPAQFAQHIIDTTSQSDDSNVRRAARAFQTVAPSYDDDTLSQGISDLLCDLRHLCDIAGFSFAELDNNAHRMYLMELRDCGIAAHHEFSTAINEQME